MPFITLFKHAETGELLERMFSTRAAVPEVLTAENDPDGRLGDGETALHAPFALGPRTHGPPRYPFVSHTIAVDPGRLQEARERSGCEFTPDGRLVVKSRRDRLRACKALGYTELS